MTQLESKHVSIIEALTGGVRVLSLDQVARLTDLDAGEAQSLLGELLRGELVFVETHLVSIPDYAARPVLSWAPGDNTPDFGPIAYRLRSRVGAPVERELVLYDAHQNGHACAQVN